MNYPSKDELDTGEAGRGPPACRVTPNNRVNRAESGLSPSLDGATALRLLCASRGAPPVTC